MTGLALAVAALVGYLLGSVSGSLLLGRFRNLDIRSMGSGNAGGTNALRSVGWRFALGVILVDLGKGAVAAFLGLWLLRSVFGFADAAVTGAALAAYFAVVGHVWPVYFGFRGGKGAGTAVGAISVLAPWCILPLFLVWVITILGTGYVGLATILAGLSLVPAVWVLGPSPLPPAIGALAIAIAITLIFTHRSNLARLRDGSENRFERARLLKLKRKRNAPSSQE
jgi:glycerol-3-phosphate acyltransferase PlsY